MAEKVKRMCKWKKGEIEKKLDTYRGVVCRPKYVCLKCGRVAKVKKYLCRPTSLGADE